MNEIVMDKKLYAICTNKRAGYAFDKKKIKKNGIKKGKKYAVSDIHIYNSYTNIELIISGVGENRYEFFNSVFFQIVDSKGKIYNVFSDIELNELYRDEYGKQRKCIDYLKQGLALPFDV